MKRLAPLILVLLLLPSAALATDRSNDETERLNRDDMALAKQATVQKRDLVSGWRLVRSGSPLPSDDRCAFDPDLSAYVITGKHETRFSAGTGAQLVSDVGVFRNLRDAVGDFKASAKPAFLGCLKRAVLESAQKAHLQARITSSRISSPRVGAQSVRYRVVATVHGSVPRFTLYTDVLAFRQGRSQAVLMFSTPFAPLRGQVALARTVARRMK